MYGDFLLLDTEDHRRSHSKNQRPLVGTRHFFLHTNSRAAQPLAWLQRRNLSSRIMSATIPSRRTKFESIHERVHSGAVAAPQSQCTIAAARDEVFQLGSIVGKMCSTFMTVPRDNTSQRLMGDEVAIALARVLIQLFRLSKVCGVDMRVCVLKKMELNGRKYPVELCKVRTVCLFIYSSTVDSFLLYQMTGLFHSIY